jgi:phosphoesterase RecJ-like protein
MIADKDTRQIETIVSAAQKIVVIQADNPDGDSLASSLALEQILEEQGKKVVLYCAVDMPGYLKHLKGWDRVSSELPSDFDASIIVDTSSTTLLEKLTSNGQQNWLATKPCIVLDHHAEANNVITFARVLLNDHDSSSTGELIYKVAQAVNWSVDVTAGEFVMSAILSDTQGLTNDLAGADTYRLMAELVDSGVNRPKLEEARRLFSKMDPRIFKYKAVLIDRAELLVDGQLAYIEIPQKEITEFSPLYNPAPLIQPDMLQTEGVGIAIVVKQYDDGRITGAIRCNRGYGIASKVAEKLGGGGHPYAAGFKVLGGRPLSEIKSECIKLTTELIKEAHNEAA